MEKLINILFIKKDYFKCLNKFILVGIVTFGLFSLNIIKLCEPVAKDLKKKFLIEIQKSFTENNKVNINKIEELIFKKDKIVKEISSAINIGFTLDPNYLLQTIITASSIMATQKNTTKIRFHFGVTQNFTSQHMIKLYNLKERINNNTEFNFYYLKGAMKKMKNFHRKGEACPGKFELPELLPDDVQRLIIFDAGDVLVLRDLTELYNYSMNHYWALAPPEPICIFKIVKRDNITKYLNIGSILLNVIELKKNKFWDLYTQKRNIRKGGQPDQTLFNILVPDDKKDYFPFRFGTFSLFCNDDDSDQMKYKDYNFKEWFTSGLSKNYPENPKSEIGILAQTYNPLFIHQFCDKWSEGKGLSIYRHLAKYFIRLTGIEEEICKKISGYCL